MEKPILFNTEMVQAILEGRKTVTRRVIKLPKHVEEQENGLYTLYAEGRAYIDAKFETVKDYINSPCIVGDILYVRETWWRGDILNSNEDIEESDVILYAADGWVKGNLDYETIKWRPSIHMPKEAARIFLEVTNVRVERLQDITEEGAREEGVRQYTKDGEVFKYAVNEYQYKWSEMPRNPIEAFKKLWDSCYSWPKCWTYNPWVWVIEFKVKEIKCNGVH